MQTSTTIASFVAVSSLVPKSLQLRLPLERLLRGVASSLQHTKATFLKDSNFSKKVSKHQYKPFDGGRLMIFRLGGHSYLPSQDGDSRT